VDNRDELISPNAPVQVAVLNGLGDVGGSEVFLAVQIRDCAGDLQYPVVGAADSPNFSMAAFRRAWEGSSNGQYSLN